MTNEEPIHVVPTDGTDVIEHEEALSCECNPARHYDVTLRVPVYVYNRLMDQPH